ncbi:MAG: PilN domain-containing protein [Longimicrobiaceae bacterium]
MLEINLLPGGEKDRAKASGRARALPSGVKLPGDPWMAGLGVGAALVLLLLVFSFWNGGRKTASLEREIEHQAEDSVRFASTIELVELLQARQDTIQRKIGIIRSVDDRRYVWPHILDEVSAALPEFTWITRVASREAASAPTALSLEGNAGSTQALTRFMKNLEGSPFLEGVTLVTSEQVSQDGRVFHRFTLEATYQEPDDAFLATEPVVIVEDR